MMENYILDALAIAMFVGGYFIYRIHDLVKAYSKGYGNESGKIDAATHKLSQLEKQVEATTRVAEEIKTELIEKAESRRVLRQKLEELCEEINIPTNIIVNSLRSGEKSGTISIRPENMEKIENSLLKTKVLSAIYFKKCAERINNHNELLRIFIDKYDRDEGNVDIDDFKGIILECREINSEIIKLGSELFA
jgi:predicted TIM-barrel enzyme